MEKIDEIVAGPEKKVAVDVERCDEEEQGEIDYVGNEDRKGMKYRKYSAQFKLEVVDFSKKNSRAATMRKYRVSESNILLWRKEKNKLKELVEEGKAKSCRLPGGGRKPVDYDMQVK